MKYLVPISSTLPFCVFSCLFGIMSDRLAARHPVDKPALALIMTHNHAKDLDASELGPLRIYRRYGSFID